MEQILVKHFNTGGIKLSDLVAQQNNGKYEQNCLISLHTKTLTLPNIEELRDKINTNRKKNDGTVYDITDLTIKGTGLRKVKIPSQYNNLLSEDDTKNKRPASKKFYSELGIISSKLEPVLLLFDSVNMSPTAKPYQDAIQFFEKNNS